MKIKKHTQASAPVNNTNRPSRLKEILTGSIPTLIVWNFLFILTCVPILTIGPSMAAMSFCMNALVKNDQVKMNPAKFYLDAFRTSFGKALPVGIYFLFITLLFGAGFFVYSYLSPENTVYVSMSSLSMVILSFFWGVMMHMYPLMFDFEKTDWDGQKVFMRTIKLTELISESGRTAAACWKQTALALVFVVVFFGILLIFMPLTLPVLALIGYSAIALAAAMAHTEIPY
ncbi:MAG: DUF624 domain-containing protein [Lachnospiraceae bacterium]|nr:DUF624 domain-containing protein [Lachnospiraceae bacterium]